MVRHYRILYRAMILLMTVSVLSAPLLIAGQTPLDGPHSPKDPSAPSLKDGKGRDAASDFPATIVTARGDTRTGSLILKFDSIEVEASEDGALRKKAVPLADIDSIEFTRWRGTMRRKNEFAFYPSEAKIILRNKKVMISTGNIAALNRILFRDSRGSRLIYSYFYDYRNGNAWKNSGQSDMGYPEKNPFGDTLVKMVFIRTEMNNLLEKLFSK